IGPTQNRIRALAESLGIQAFDTYNTGDNVYFRDGQRQRYNAQAPLTGPVPPDPTGVAEAVRFLAQLDQMAAEVPREAPWSAPKAAEWDSQTVETFKQANALTPGGRFLFDVSTQGVFASEPRDLSLLFYLFYISAAGDEKTPGTLERLVNTAGGA